MRNSILIAICMIASLFIASPRHSAQERNPSIDGISWLAGCWESGQGDKRREEFWFKPAGGAMLGMGRAVADGRMTEFEFMRLHEEKGNIFFTARPSNQPEASFKLSSLNGTEAVFENPQHDFPQRVIYRLLADGSLLARIEGELKGKRRSAEFPFKRAKCD